MIEIPYEQDAKAGQPMPSLDAEDTGIYQAIACLTSRYRLGQIDATQAQSDMAAIRNAYDRSQKRKAHEAEEQAYMDKHYQMAARFWSSCEWACDNFGKDQTIENAITMWKVIAGLLKKKD